MEDYSFYSLNKMCEAHPCSLLGTTITTTYYTVGILCSVPLTATCYPDAGSGSIPRALWALSTLAIPDSFFFSPTLSFSQSPISEPQIPLKTWREPETLFSDKCTVRTCPAKDENLLLYFYVFLLMLVREMWGTHLGFVTLVSLKKVCEREDPVIT